METSSATPPPLRSTGGNPPPITPTFTVQDLAPRYHDTSYRIRRKILTLFAAKFLVYDPKQRLAFFAKQKAFKLKEDFRIYTDETCTTEALLIRARSILDFGTTYDIIDATTRQPVGALRRKVFKSMIRDEWLILDTQDREIGLIQEDSPALALIRRLLCGLVPQRFHAQVSGQPVFEFKQNFNPFVLKIDLDFSNDTRGLLDRRMGIAAGLLLAAIEGRQD